MLLKKLNSNITLKNTIEDIAVMWTMNLGACVCAVLLQVVLADTTVYDLTYNLVSDKMPMLPNSTGYHMNSTNSSSPTLRLENITTSTAVGTHVQAPCRYQAGQNCITDIPFTNLMGPVVLMSVSYSSVDTPINASDLQAWEKKNGSITAGSIVLIKTGWGQNWSNISKYVGTNDAVNSTNMHFPGLTVQAGTYLASKGVLGVGIDTMSVDYGQSNGTYQAHTALAQKNIYTILNVDFSSIDEKKMKNRTGYVMPLRIVGAGAAPCRIFISKNAAYGLLSKPTLFLVGICLAILSYVNH